jgi:hypothetical protein
VAQTQDAVHHIMRGELVRVEVIDDTANFLILVVSFEVPVLNVLGV